MYNSQTSDLQSLIKTSLNWVRSKPALSLLIQACLGSLVLAVSAQIAAPLPFTPVPTSMQTLAVFLLVCMQGKTAVASVALYLAQASIGLPVLAAGKINPFWLMGPTGGYLVGFLLSVYPISLLLGKKPIWTRALAASFACEAMILLCGTLWLAFLMGWSKALTLGCLPFITGNLIKCVMGTGLVFPIEYGKRILRQWL
jgi:biotin transport system substrate-specific component